jgi:hypothetical protein
VSLVDQEHLCAAHHVERAMKKSHLGWGHSGPLRITAARSLLPDGGGETTD